MKKFIFILFIFVKLTIIACGQGNEVNPDGYNIFYYENGKISSEGTMRQGKPDGYWKTYYPNGQLKSEGNRKEFELDSLWIFFAETGDTTLKITYRSGKKTGYLYTYEQSLLKENGKEIRKWLLISKELYLQDVKQGKSFYYEKGILSKSVNWQDGRKHGVSKEFDKDGKVTGIAEYSKDYLLFRERINRVDSKGLKQGTWKTFHPNDKIAIELNYIDDTLNGYYKEFDMAGKLIKILKYRDGKAFEESEAAMYNPVKTIEEFYENGKVKYRGGFKDSVPVGLHKAYSEDGTQVIGTAYTDSGFIEGTGALDANDKRQGLWKFYYETGELKAEGNYKDNLKTGDWIYYYPDSTVEQRGKYVNDRPSGLWKWYFDNGNIWREENLRKGQEEGAFVEYDRDSNIVIKGEYVDGEREGMWFYRTGDNTEEGLYQAGMREGEWKHYHPNGQLSYKGSYVQGTPDGKHVWYYENGLKREEGFYSMGVKEKNWVKYDMEGLPYITITFKNDKEYKINGVKLKLPKGISEE